jgi:hypothetical protein
LTIQIGSRPCDETLSAACKTGDRNIVRAVLNVGAIPDGKTFTWACMSKDLFILDLVISAQAKPDSESLVAACASGIFEIVQKAISCGAPHSPKAEHLASQVSDKRILEAVQRLARSGP